MIITLYNKEITISDTNQFERINIDNYKTVEYGGISSGISMFSVVKNGAAVLCVRTNNLAIIDKRTD